MKAPKAPDPVATANAQGAMNQNTAVQQQLLNMVDQSNPYGSVNYNQTGSSSFTGADGKVYSVPKFQQTTSFTPEGQAIFDETLAAQNNLAETANTQSAAVQDTLSKPFEFNNQDAADWSYDLASSRILPQQQQDEAALRSRLVNSGLRPGTQAYSTELTRLSQNNRDQLNQLALTGRSQAFGEAIQTRNQPLNELNALLTQSQLQNPGSASSATPQASVAGVDYAGLVQQNYQNKLQASQAGMGGLFGLAGSLGSAAIMSDMRVKTEIKRVGSLDNGLPVYSYRYKSGGPIHIGVMAQDVELQNPGAVVEMNGIKHVRYEDAVR